MTPEEMAIRFNTNRYTSEEMDQIQSDGLVVAERINDNAPESREKALAFTKLEEAMFWASEAIARRS